MPEFQPTPDRPAPRGRPWAAYFAAFGVAMVAVAFLLVAGRSTPSMAAEDPKVDILYLSVTNEGPTAKGWYDGAPSPGVPVQDALSKFAHEGYKVVAVTEDLRSTTDSAAFVVLLQRVR